MKKFDLLSGNAWEALSRDQMKEVAGGRYPGGGNGCTLTVTANGETYEYGTASSEAASRACFNWGEDHGYHGSYQCTTVC